MDLVPISALFVQNIASSLVDCFVAASHDFEPQNVAGFVVWSVERLQEE
jgi:hypothetical protein